MSNGVINKAIAKEQAIILNNIPAIIENSVLLESHKDTKGNKGVKQVHRMYLPMRLDNKVLAVKVTVREYENGYYDAEIDSVNKAYDIRSEKEIISPTIKMVGEASDVLSRNPNPSKSLRNTKDSVIVGEDTITIRQLLENVNDNIDGSYDDLKQQTRGSIVFNGMNGVINLMESSDASTVLHEMMHWYSVNARTIIEMVWVLSSLKKIIRLYRIMLDSLKRE